jgi:hypothetical protein
MYKENNQIILNIPSNFLSLYQIKYNSADPTEYHTPYKVLAFIYLVLYKLAIHWVLHITVV